MSLPRANDARYDARIRQNETGCLAETRVEILNELERWGKNSDDDMPWLFVLVGLAGTGKSTIAWTFCQLFNAFGQLGASFFFTRSEASSSNPFLVFTTIAFQLASRYPRFRESLTEALKADPDVVSSTLQTQFQRLLVEPLRVAAKSFGDAPVVLVVDAIDECSKYRTQILTLLCSLRSEVDVRIMLFISLRPEPDLQAVLPSANTQGTHRSFILHDVEKSVVRGDIERFLKSGLSDVARRHPLSIDPLRWPSSADICTLVDRSEQLFIYAATVVKFIADDTMSVPKERLIMTLRPAVKAIDSPYKQLDQLYQQVLESALPEPCSDDALKRFHAIVGTIILLYDPLSFEALARLLRMDYSKMEAALRHLHSLITVPDGEGEIRLIHPSFRDFMTQRCPRWSRYNIIPADRHRDLAMACFKTMELGLKRYICDIQDLGKPNNEIPDLDARIKRCIPADLQYACRHWGTHLSYSLYNADISGVEIIVTALSSFGSLHLLHWLEVLSLTGNLGEALPTLRLALDWMSVSTRLLMKLVQEN